MSLLDCRQTLTHESDCRSSTPGFTFQCIDNGVRGGGVTHVLHFSFFSSVF